MDKSLDKSKKINETMEIIIENVKNNLTRMLPQKDGNVINRRHKRSNSEEESQSDHGPPLTLVDQVFIVALNDGRTSFWNDNLSGSLRGCVLVELNLRGRINLEPRTLTKKVLGLRKVIVTNASLTGERILDETLKHIVDSREGATVSLWLEYLNGENWNPWNWRYQLKGVKERVAKDLVEKGFLTTSKFSYVFFDTTTYPLKNIQTKLDITKYIQNGLLRNWKGKPHRMEFRQLALILLCYAGDVLDEVLSNLDYAAYELAKIRLNSILESDFTKEAQMEPGFDLSWAVFAALLN